jgi:hypothetical protein
VSTRTKTRRRPPSRREQARRARQRSETRRRTIRDAVGRTKTRQAFSARAKSLLGTDDPETARLAFTTNPRLFEQLLTEYDEVPEYKNGPRNAVYVHEGYDSDHFEFVDSAVNVESWYKQDHRRDDIDDALADGWWAMERTAAEGLRQARLDNHVRDMTDPATGGGLTKTSETWLADLYDYLGVDQKTGL